MDSLIFKPRCQRMIFVVASLFLLFSGLFLVAQAHSEQTPNQPPTADFFSTKQEGNPPLTVQFANVSSGEYSNSIWDFGDGQTSTESTPTHTYAITGTYTVALTVSGTLGSNTLVKNDLINVHAFLPVHPDGWDLNFGDYGQLAVDLCGWNGSRPLVAHQPDGKILLALECWNFDGLHELYVMRYQADGAIDLSFGEYGRVQLPGGALAGLHLLPNGNVLIVSGLTLYQLTGNGTLDGAFGANGVARAFAETATGGYVKSALLPDGKIVGVGTMGNQPMLARYNPNGALDTTFANQGYLLTAVSAHDALSEESNRWSTVALQADGKILVGRLNYQLIDPFNQTYLSKAQLQRFTTIGTTDPAFGINGVVEFDGYVPKIALQSTGRIVMSGGSNGLNRLLPNGTIDSSFVIEGIADYGFTLDGADRILLINTDTPQLSVVRLQVDGTKDHTFAKDGELRQPNLTQGIFLTSESNGTILLGVGLPRSGFAGLAFVRYIDDHPVPPPVSKSLTLLYAVLDNNLGEDATRLINNIEAGVRPDSNVRLLVDGPGDNDVYLYDVMQDSNPFCPSVNNPTCDGRYAEGINFWHIANENSAHPDSLYQFLVDGVNAFTNTSSINVALIGHGSGWSANVLPGQPSIWRGQNDTLGGMLWDDHPGAGQGESRSLSTLMLGQALSWASAQSGRQIDLLYLDGCSMGMAEVAYEVRSSAHYLLASPNIDWASFNYDELLPKTASKSGQELGKAWLALEASRLRSTTGYPFTLALIDLSKTNELATSLDGLAHALQSALPTDKAAIGAAYQAADKFDSNYDGAINNTDAYVDLGAFAQQLAAQFPNNSTVLSATTSVQTVLSSTILAKEHEDGSPWIFPDQQWSWSHFSGLALYAPLSQDETRRQIFYNQDNLRLAQNSTWDEFLADYWAGDVNAAGESVPVCHQTSDGCQGLANPLPVQAPPVYNVFMPLVAMYEEIEMQILEGADLCLFCGDPCYQISASQFFFRYIRMLCNRLYNYREFVMMATLHRFACYTRFGFVIIRLTATS